jgi:DNA-binding transcriptional ArsR family regulator
MLKTFKISHLEQLRLLADPLKLKLLQAFAEGPKTTREIAEALGENLTRLYRHVDALLDAGLIEIVKEEPKRGTVERTFRAIAYRFEVDRELLGGNEQGDETIRNLVRAGEDEIVQGFENAGDDDEPILMRLRIKGSAAQLEELRRLLQIWVETAQAFDDEETGDAASEEAGALIAFYPIRD